MSDKTSWSDDVEAVREAMDSLRHRLIDSWAVPTIEWINRKLTR